MKKIKYLVAVLALFVFSASAVMASVDEFDDVPWNDGTSWYYEAVYALQSFGVVEGYDDGNFYPGNDVNRAELSVMLYRLYGYLQNPTGDEWARYSNDYYSAWYPVVDTTYPYSELDSCGLSVNNGGGGDLFRIDCFDTEETSIADQIDDELDQMGDESGYTTEDIVVNDFDATHVVITNMEYPTLYRELIYVEDVNTLYAIESYTRNVDFDEFYRSFHLN